MNEDGTSRDLRDEVMHRPGVVTDDVDLAACIAGDAAAWSRFVRRVAPFVLAVVRRAAGGSMTHAEDDAQEVFVRLVQQDFRLLRAFDPSRAKLETYLGVVARSVVHERTRRRALPVDRDAAPERLIDPAASARRAGAVTAAGALPFGDLPEQQRTVLLLMHRQGLSVDEVARRLGVEPQTVRSAHHKAIRRLRDLLGLGGEEAVD